MRTLTTLVSAIGPGMEAAVVRLGQASNVAVEVPPEIPTDPVAAMTVVGSTWRKATKRSAIYTVVALDPLGPVVDQWAARLTAQPEALELVIGLVPDLPTPDYYLVSPGLGDPHVHWYAAHVRSLAPSRVVVCDAATPGVLARVVSELPYGRALPQLRELASTARVYVPVPDTGVSGIALG